MSNGFFKTNPDLKDVIKCQRSKTNEHAKCGQIDMHMQQAVSNTQLKQTDDMINNSESMCQQRSQKVTNVTLSGQGGPGNTKTNASETASLTDVTRQIANAETKTTPNQSMLRDVHSVVTRDDKTPERNRPLLGLKPDCSDRQQRRRRGSADGATNKQRDNGRRRA